MSEYTLHGRPLKVGDKVWDLDLGMWRNVNETYVYGEYSHVDIHDVHESQEEYTWDIPPTTDISKIPPPLCWVEGHPIRIGTAMMHVDGYAVIFDRVQQLEDAHAGKLTFETPTPLCWIEGEPVFVGSAMMSNRGQALIVKGPAGTSEHWLICEFPDGMQDARRDTELTFNFPTKPTKRKKTVEFWINKYEDPFYWNRRYCTEKDAKLEARDWCQGQHKVTYEVDIE